MAAQSRIPSFVTGNQGLPHFLISVSGFRVEMTGFGCSVVNTVLRYRQSGFAALFNFRQWIPGRNARSLVSELTKVRDKPASVISPGMTGVGCPVVNTVL
ncbi:hypothetical protein QUF72_20080, partial [Desulfobacterales bacterium HSG2]|nr:hypothetical protein [Desulfobacterales bacterium HSG2]